MPDSAPPRPLTAGEVTSYAHLDARQRLATVAGTAAAGVVYGLRGLLFAVLLNWSSPFAAVLVLLPLLGVIEKPKPRPASIADSVRKKHGSAPAAAVAAE